jgi:hypothetical protein
LFGRPDEKDEPVVGKAGQSDLDGAPGDGLAHADGRLSSRYIESVMLATISEKIHRDGSGKEWTGLHR